MTQLYLQYIEYSHPTGLWYETSIEYNLEYILNAFQNHSDTWKFIAINDYCSAFRIVKLTHEGTFI